MHWPTRGQRRAGHQQARRRAPGVLLLSSSEAIGGMERVVVNLARQLTVRGWQVDMLFPQSCDSTALIAWCREQGVAADLHAAILHTSAPHTIRDMLALRRLVLAKPHSLVNLHYGSTFISLKDVFAIWCARRRCYVSIHLPESWASVGNRKRWMTRVAGYFVDGVVANSQATRLRLLEAGISPKKISLIPCGVQPPARTPNRKDARSQLGIAGDTFVIGTCSRLVKIKNVDLIIRAVAAAELRASSRLLLIAGDGPERAALEAMATQFPEVRIRFLGHLPDPTDFYAALDVFVLASNMEGFGLVLVEAAFHGVPSIAANVGGVGDVIANHVTGITVQAGNLAQLTSAIDRLQSDSALRARLGQAACMKALASFTDIRMADQYERALTGRPVQDSGSTGSGGQSDNYRIAGRAPCL